MNQIKNLYPTVKNPLLFESSRALPEEIAVIGAGTIGPDIGYYLKSAMPSIKLYLVDVVEKPRQAAENRLSAHAQKAAHRKKMKADDAKAVLDNIV